MNNKNKHTINIKDGKGKNSEKENNSDAEEKKINGEVEKNDPQEEIAKLKDLLLRLREVEPLLGPVHFGNKAEFLGLQTADFHAYEAWKHLKNQYLAGRPFDMKTVRKSLRAGMIACDEMECSILSLRTFDTMIEEIRRLKSVKLLS